MSENVYQLPSGRTVRLRPRNDEEEGEQEVEPRPNKSRRTDVEDEDSPDMGMMEALEESEATTLHLTSGGCYMPLITCDEPMDISYLGFGYAQDLTCGGDGLHQSG